jgi:hypothetical protein
VARAWALAFKNRDLVGDHVAINVEAARDPIRASSRR